MFIGDKKEEVRIEQTYNRFCITTGFNSSGKIKCDCASNETSLKPVLK